jgi:pyruvate dehydrogenase E2 component (dihydrolipoamide acetyltransferase)
MAFEFTLPELGENVESGTLTQLLVSEGDSLKKDQALMELETDKAVIEVPIDREGTIKELFVSEGDEVKVGQKILLLDDGKDQPSGDTSKKSEETTVSAPSSDGGSAPTKDEKEQESDKKPAKTKKPMEKESTSGEKASKSLFQLPDLGENVESGTISKIMVKEGEQVETDQNLIELETEKAVVEIPVDKAGTVTKILVKEGDEIKVGQHIIELSGKSAEIDAVIPEETEEEQPDEAETVEDKSEKESEDTVQPVTSAPKIPQKKEVIEQPESTRPVPAAPSVRRFAREIGINIQEVPGTGPGGRISIDDIKNYSRTVNTRKSVSPGIFKGIEQEELPDFSQWGETERQPMNKVREKTARHLGYAWATIPHVTQFDKADITDLEKLRKEHGKQVEAAGGKLTVTAILLKITAAALKKFPQFNASIDMDKMEIIYKKYVNIGIAVDTDRGLLVPVVRNVDEKNITELSIELGELATKARDKKLSLEEMQGGNFSISNLGGIGGTAFTPVVNSPEAAILGVSRSETQAVFREGQFVPRLILPLSLSYDHRLIDGADAARFLRWVSESLEQPFKILLDG